MGAIYRREMGAFFTSGIAYVFLFVYFLFSGLFFYVGSIKMGTTDTSWMFSSLFMIIIFLIPVLTMKLFSEEKKQKTDQGLLTAPVGLWSIVLGKYFAALTLFVLAESIVFVFAFIMNVYGGNVVWSTLIANYLAMFLLAAAFIAVGVFISSLTENQMSSAVASLVVLLFLYLIDTVAVSLITTDEGFLGAVKEFLLSISFYSKYVEFTMGLFNLSSVVFYLSTAFLFNFFTVRVFEKRRWS